MFSKIELKDGMRVRCTLYGDDFRTIHRLNRKTWIAVDDEGVTQTSDVNFIRECLANGTYVVCDDSSPPAEAVARPGNWLASLSSEERKEVAVARGLFAYFPDALALVARHSVRSNEKHNPGEPVHWSREKSSDHEDCIGRHSIAVAVDANSLDGDVPHIVCRAWRALAALQLWAEAQPRG